MAATPPGAKKRKLDYNVDQKIYDEDMKTQQQRNIDATQKQAQNLGEEEYVPMSQSSVVEREII